MCQTTPQRTGRHASAAMTASTDRHRIWPVCDGMELVVAGNDLVELAAVGVFLEDDEMLEQVRNRRWSKTPRISTSSSRIDDWGHRSRPSMVRQTLNHSWLAVSDPMRACSPSETTSSLVVVEQRGDFLLVGLQLLEGVQIVASSSAAFFSSMTPSGRPLTKTTMSGRRLCWPSMTVNWLTASQSLLRGVVEVDQPHPVPGNGAVLAAILDLHAVPQHLVEGPVGPDERRRADPQDLPQGLLAGLVGNVRVQPVDGVAQPPHENHVAKRIPLGGRLARRDVRAVADRHSPVPRTRTGRRLRRWIRYRLRHFTAAQETLSHHSEVLRMRNHRPPQHRLRAHHSSRICC